MARRNAQCGSSCRRLASSKTPFVTLLRADSRSGAKAFILQMPQRVAPLEIDPEIYKWRHLIENFFCKLKEFKRIAMRSDKADDSFSARIYAAAAIISGA